MSGSSAWSGPGALPGGDGGPTGPGGLREAGGERSRSGSTAGGGPGPPTRLSLRLPLRLPLRLLLRPSPSRGWDLLAGAGWPAGRAGKHGPVPAPAAFGPAVRVRAASPLVMCLHLGCGLCPRPCLRLFFVVVCCFLILEHGMSDRSSRSYSSS